MDNSKLCDQHLFSRDGRKKTYKSIIKATRRYIKAMQIKCDKEEINILLGKDICR